MSSSGFGALLFVIGILTLLMTFWFTLEEFLRPFLMANGLLIGAILVIVGLLFAICGGD